MNVDGTNISMTRGDSEFIEVSCSDEYGNKVDFEDGDVIYFTVKHTINNTDKIIQKVVTSFTNGNAIIEILPDDTKNIAYQVYIYDIQLNKKDGTVKTIIKPSKFTITGEVTYD